ncbi:phenylacetate--CoA ligase family protein [Vibrio coralliilyticus]|uniref:phenylacetate--CoA ligase family protein n=1 Tax=Vibrio coralliilyticus TaxID=190893 RepID=UPI001E36A184|nr:hypothetical protein [Vibrio coralliilyticus]MCC2524559.1 hypothetical protein [Vibrio coralliilyticus]
MITKKIYSILPAPFQNLAVSIYGKLIFKQRYSGAYDNLYQGFIKKDYSDFKVNLSEQNRLLTEFVKFAVSNSPFYKEFYTDVDIEGIKGVEDLHKLPILTKEMLRENIDSVKTVTKKESISSFTGGTTGKSLEVFFTRQDFQCRMAYLDAFKFKVGVEPFKSKKATFSGREVIQKEKNNVFWRNNSAYNQRLYSTFHINEKTIPYYLENLNSFKPEVINGFVSAIYDIAKYILDNNLTMSFIPLAVFTTSETLLPHHREIIEKAFGCKVYNQYASAEGAPFITECSHGELHYNMDTGVIENKPGSDSVLVTSFTTHGTPLIRYDIGDKIIFKEGVCSCGSRHPLVKEISGRAVDYLTAIDGRKVSLSHLADVIKGLPNCIRNIQFIQKMDNEIDILLEVDESLYNLSHERKLLDSLVYRFGSDTIFNITLVDCIPKEKSGKYRLIKKN